MTVHVSAHHGSTTKAFTTTLVGMLVDEGRMRWDDPVVTYLTEFMLKVQSKDTNDLTGKLLAQTRLGHSSVLFGDWGAMWVPHRYVASTDVAGRTIFQVERVEIGVELAPDTFTLQPFAGSSEGR